LGFSLYCRHLVRQRKGKMLDKNENDRQEYVLYLNGFPQGNFIPSYRHSQPRDIKPLYL
jgi:hypothetical protein